MFGRIQTYILKYLYTLLILNKLFSLMYAQLIISLNTLAAQQKFKMKNNPFELFPEQFIKKITTAVVSISREALYPKNKNQFGTSLQLLCNLNHAIVTYFIFIKYLTYFEIAYP